MASNDDVSIAAWYLNKADQCEQMAKDSSHPEDRDRYQAEARRWREIAADIAKNERDRFGSSM
jgi:hypothetical protein